MRVLLTLWPALLAAQATDLPIGEARREGCRKTDSACAVITGTLDRTIDAAPWRGLTVRLWGWLRVEPGDAAQLSLAVDLPGAQMAFADTMDDRPVTAPEWTLVDITAPVDPTADRIRVAVMQRGKGRAWVEGLRLDAVPEPAATASARDAIAEQYARIDSAYARGEVETLAGLAMPGAELAIAGQSIPLRSALAEIDAQMKKGARFESHTSITSLGLVAGQATVVTRNRSTMTLADGRREVATRSRDTWRRVGPVWRLAASALLRGDATPETGATLAAVAGELRQRAIPLDDLAAFGRAVGDARIVALGEAARGVREFAQLRHRLFEYLVTKKGFTVLAVEANWPEALAVDRYIKTGEGDLKTALAGMYFWTWTSEETRELVEWMRAYNRAPGAHPQVSFTSFDMQTGSVAARRAQAYVTQYLPGLAESAASLVAEVEALETARGDSPGDNAPEVAQHAAGLRRTLDGRRAELVQASSMAAWRDARHAVDVVWQAATQRVAGRGPEWRDEMMANNVEWLAREAYAGEKIVLWGHNGHVTLASQWGAKSMGSWLRERFGRALYVVGFAFRGGQVRAVGLQDGVSTGLAVHTVAPSPAESGDAALSAVGVPRFFLDMALLSPQSPLGKWLAEPHRFHNVGAVWPAGGDGLADEIPAREYDGMIFVETVHPITP